MNIKNIGQHAKQVFLSEQEIRLALQQMEKDATLSSKPSLMNDNDASSSIREVSFMERHMTYLREHPKVNPEHYLSNLRTMIKIRR